MATEITSGKDILNRLIKDLDNYCECFIITNSEYCYKAEVGNLYYNGESKKVWIYGYADWCGENDWQITSPSYWDYNTKTASDIVGIMNEDLELDENKLYRYDNDRGEIFEEWY